MMKWEVLEYICGDKGLGLMGKDPRVQNIDLTHTKRPKCHEVVREVYGH